MSSVVDSRQAKSQIRKQVRATLAAMSADQQRAASHAACDRLLELEALQRARVVMLYMPLELEVDVTPAARALLAQGKTVCVPKVDWQWYEMDPIALTSLEDEAMHLDRYGVRVPRIAQPVPLDSINVIIVPALAFDPQGNRLGRNAGFYDRFLSRLNPATLKVGVAFEQQIVDNVPVEPHDIAMDVVVTDHRILSAGHCS